MTAFWAFLLGAGSGAACAWCWAMCRQADEFAAVAKQFDDGLSQAIRVIRLPKPTDPGQPEIRAINRAIKGVRQRIGQHEAVDAARAREGRGPFLFYRRAAMDDEPESFIG